MRAYLAAAAEADWECVGVVTVTPGRGGPAGDVGVLAAPPSSNTRKTMIINPNEDSWSIIQGQEVLYISVDWNS